jgi:acyl-coenzyme A synthetase/AMP-(fatty) acid ligase
VLDRFGQTRPKVLFCADGYFFKGKRIDSLERMASILRELRSIERVVVVPYTEPASDIRGLPNAVHWAISPRNLAQIQFEQLLRASALHHVLLRHHGLPKYGAERRRHPRPPSEGVDVTPTSPA